MKLPSLILASNSPRRAELLRQSGIDFRTVPSDAGEIHHEQLTAREISQINAYRKARSVAKRYPDAVVLATERALRYALICEISRFLASRPRWKRRMKCW